MKCRPDRGGNSHTEPYWTSADVPEDSGVHICISDFHSLFPWVCYPEMLPFSRRECSGVAYILTSCDFTIHQPAYQLDDYQRATCEIVLAFDCTIFVFPRVHRLLRAIWTCSSTSSTLPKRVHLATSK